MRQKVFVGISGGVDSSVSALLLKEQGFDVAGVFIKAWYPDFIVCNWREEMRDAMRVCAKLDIPFVLCDLEDQYKKYVIDYMVSEYEKGRTPNPDVMCNKYVKFDGFLKFALEKGADFIATGHYAQNINEDGAYKMIQSVDTEKDQTYFLWTLTQEQLRKTLFPIGHLKKEQVRRIADKYKLFTSTKKDSQGLCFIGHVDIKDFLRHYIDIIPGNVLDESGSVIGKHDGAALYTIGERHGFAITKTSDSKDVFYVISKNVSNNTITVSKNKKSESLNNFELVNVSFTRNLAESDWKNINSQYRYHGPICRTTLCKKDENFLVSLDDLRENVSPGQSIVFYKNNECLGGGILSK